MLLITAQTALKSGILWGEEIIMHKAKAFSSTWHYFKCIFLKIPPTKLTFNWFYQIGSQFIIEGCQPLQVSLHMLLVTGASQRQCYLGSNEVQSNGLQIISVIFKNAAVIIT